MARSALVAASAISDWSGAAALLGAPKRVAIAVLPVERRCSTLGPCGVTTFRHGTSHATPHEPPSRCRSEEHTSELQSLMRISYAVFCLKKKIINITYILNITVLYNYANNIIKYNHRTQHK